MSEKLLEELRLKVLHGHGSEIRSILLTKNQIDLVLFINLKGKTTASEIAKLKNVSIQNASTKLAALHSKGYLDRETLSAESGGIEHCYTVRLGR